MSYDEIVCFRRLAAKALLQAQPSAFASLFGDRDLLFGSRHAKEEAISQEEIERLHAELEASARAEEAAAAAAAHHHRSAEFRFRLTVPSSLHVVIHSERLNLPPTFHAPSTDLPRPPTDLPCAFRRPSTSLPPTFHGLPPTFHGLPPTFHGLPPTFHGLPRPPTDLPRPSTAFSGAHGGGRQIPRRPLVRYRGPRVCQEVRARDHGEIAPDCTRSRCSRSCSPHCLPPTLHRPSTAIDDLRPPSTDFPPPSPSTQVLPLLHTRLFHDLP